MNKEDLNKFEAHRRGAVLSWHTSGSDHYFGDACKNQPYDPFTAHIIVGNNRTRPLTLDTADDREKWVELLRPTILPWHGGAEDTWYEPASNVTTESYSEAIKAAVIAACEKWKKSHA